MDKNGYPIFLMIKSEMDKFEAELSQSRGFYPNFKDKGWCYKMGTYYIPFQNKSIIIEIQRQKIEGELTDVEYILNKLGLNYTVTEDGKTMWTYKGLTTNEDIAIVNKSLLLAIDNYQTCCVN